MMNGHGWGRRVGAVVGLLAVCIALWLPAAAVAAAPQVQVDYEFQAPEVVRRPDGTDRVAVSGLKRWGAVGEPVLPYRTAMILLPPGQEVADLIVSGSQWSALPGVYNVEPGQRPYPLSRGKPEGPTPPMQSAYAATDWYPADPWSSVTVQQWRGHRILTLNLRPVRYLPAAGQLQWCRSLSVRVRLRAMTAEERKGGLTVSMTPKDAAALARRVDNPDLLDTYAVPANLQVGQGSGLLEPEPAYEYVIITSEALANASGMYTFQDLVALKEADGLSATVVTTEWIYANYSGDRPDGGSDDQTAIRNFITDAYSTWGTRYVLLGGDGDQADIGGESGDTIVPHRGFTIDSGWEIEYDLPADMYYGCLDGTFDYDANGLYGEPWDGPGGGEVDLLAEVHIGRAPVDSEGELSNFVAKTAAYLATTPPRDVWMVGEYIGFGGVAEWGGNYKDEIKDGCDLHGYTTVGFLDSELSSTYDVYTLYDRDDPWNDWPWSTLVGLINANIHIINHLGHAANDYVMKLVNADVDGLTNTFPFIGYSQGCYAGAFDNRGLGDGCWCPWDCIAEHLTCSAGGAVAFIANSRYGWGVWDSTDGPSQHFDREFWDAVLGEGIAEIGPANDDSKWDQVGYIGADPIGRWCAYGLNLFGDPHLRIRLGAPSRGSVELDRPGYMLPDVAVVTVIDSDLNVNPSAPDTVLVYATSDTEPVAEAVLCTETGDSTGVFVGTLAIVPGEPAADGDLQAAHGDTIAVAYVDEDDGSGGTEITRMAYAQVDTEPPSFAGIESATPGNGSVLLGWSPASDETAPITYNVYRATTSGGQGFDNPTASTSSLSYLDTGLANGQPYYYVVRAQDAAGNEETNTVELSATPVVTHTLNLCACPYGAAAVEVNGEVYNTPWWGEIAEGTLVTVRAIPDPGYQFVEWCCDAYTTDNPFAFVMDRSYYLTAYLEYVSHTLTVQKTGSGHAVVDGTPRALPWSGSFGSGAVVELEAVPVSEGWTFAGWTGDLVTNDNPTVIVMDSHKTVSANFSAHTLDVSCSADPSSVCSGGTSQLSATITDALAHSYTMYWRDMLAFDPYTLGEMGGGKPNKVAVQGNYAYCAAGGALTIYDIAAPGGPALIGVCDTPGIALDVVVSGDYAYVALLDAGIGVVNVSDPSAPVEIARYSGLERIRCLAMAGNRLYTVGRWPAPLGSYTFAVLDITVPSRPTLIGHTAAPWEAADIATLPGYAYWVDFGSLHTVDLSNPYAPALASSVYLYSPMALDAMSMYAPLERAVTAMGMYVCTVGDALRIVDVTVPSNPRLVAEHPTDWGWGVTVGGGYAYVAQPESGLRIVNVSDPGSPFDVGNYAALDGAMGVTIDGSVAYVAASGGFSAIDVSDPSFPVEIASHPTYGEATAIAVAGRYAYLAGERGTFRVVDLAAPGGPAEVGSCRVSTGCIRSVAEAGGFAYLGTWGLQSERPGVLVIDLSDPTHPREVGSWVASEAAVCPPQVLAAGGYLYARANCPGEIYALDISDPANPVARGSGPVYDRCWTNMSAADGVLYVAGTLGAVEMVDVADPLMPIKIGDLVPQTGWELDAVSAVAVTGDTAYVTSGGKLDVFDVSVPWDPLLLRSGAAPAYAPSIAVVGDRAYLTTERLGTTHLEIYHVGGPGVPRQVGLHRGIGLGHRGWLPATVAASDDYTCFNDYGWGLTVFDRVELPESLGTFSPSPDAPDAVYAAPLNDTGQDLVIILEAVATCDGEPAVSGSDTCTITVSGGADISPSSVTCAPSQVARIPISVRLGPQEADRFAFSAQVTPVPPAPALAGALSFEGAPSLPAPDYVNVSDGAVGVAWMTPLPDPVTGSIHLGDILAPVGATAGVGDSYLVEMQTAGVSLGAEELCANPGANASVTVGAQILVGDGFPSLTDLNDDGDTCDIGEFGNGDLSWADVIYAFDAWAIPGTFPCPGGSLRHWAMDAYPQDTPQEVGGDGRLSWGDIITTFDRWANPSLPRPWRTVTDPDAFLTIMAMRAEPPMRVFAEGAGPVLSVAEGSGAAGKTVRLPVRLALAGRQADRAAFSVELVEESAGGPAATLAGFEAVAGIPAPMVVDQPDGGLAVAWLTPAPQPLAGDVLLGELVVELPADAKEGDSWLVRVRAAGASLGGAESDPSVQAGADARVSIPVEPHDVAVRRFQAPKQVKAGDSKRVTVEVVNLTQTTEELEVRLLRGGEVVDTWTLTLGGKERRQLQGDCLFRAQDRPSVELRAEVVLAADTNQADNTASATVSVK